MKYWNSPDDMGLTEDQTTEILERLMNEAKASATRPCPDCSVNPGTPHLNGCDVARCIKCNTQALSCDCRVKTTDVWSGLWPGTEGCYANRLITCSDPSQIGGTGWMFDYNALAVLKSK